MSKALFLDTAFAIALSAPADQHHARAVLLADRIEATADPLVTTRAVLFEIGDALSKLRHRRAAIELLLSLDADPRVEIVSVTEDLYERAFRLYAARPDKEWGLTDCLSFVVMQDRGIEDALTTDVHFRQAGFNPLLRDD